jgi:uncharacterized protein YhhL (DUF1145 family)
MNAKRIQEVLLEFIARLFMNVFKLAIGFSLAYAYLRPAKIFINPEVLLIVSIFGIVISLIETWQDWEVVPTKKAPDAEHNHTAA